MRTLRSASKVYLNMSLHESFLYHHFLHAHYHFITYFISLISVKALVILAKMAEVHPFERRMAGINIPKS